MKLGESKATRTRILLALSVIGLTAVLAILPFGLKSFAGGQDGSEKGSSSRTVSKEDGIKNYDIRTDESKSDVLLNFRLFAGKSAVEVADVRNRFVAGENSLRQRVPTLRVEYNEDIRIPEVIAVVVNGKRAFLTEPSMAKHSKILRSFVRENNNLFGVDNEQINQLKMTADYTNPDENLSYAHLEQTINGVPVFRGEIKAGFTKDGAMFRVINNLAPGLDYADLSIDFGDPFTAVKAAAVTISYELKEAELNQNYADSNDLKVVFGTGDWATTAEKMYFPIEPGVARTAWRVLIWGKNNSYYVIVDAETGALLWRKNITSQQTQAATFNVYANSTSMMQALDNPAPLTPGPVDPNLGTQGVLANRTDITLVGNEGANSFNNLGWITDGNNTTDGNNVEAGIDRAAPDGVDAPVTGSGFRNFTFNYTPGNSSGGDNPLGAEFQKGAVTQLFYLSNRYHDEMYKLGFTEAARNFQNDNFGRGGNGNDRVSAEAQDSSGTNNANFGTPADGARGQMQMYFWSAPNPDRDGDLDAEIVIHELTHGLSNRLIGNGSGLYNLMGGGMGEGWSDFYAHCLLSEPTDPIQGIYTVGGYSTQGHSVYAGGSNGNYYYGVRAFPKAVRSFSGGAMNRPHNPLTFADIDSTQVNASDGAFPAAFAPNTFSVHFLGEVWSSALWEVRARFIQRHGHAEGNRRILQFVTDGMKLTPNTPTFLQARDAVIAAAQAGGTAADVADARVGFATRGMGDAAQITSVNPVRVVESFDPSVISIVNNSITIISENNLPANNTPDPGETVTVNLPLQNIGNVPTNNVTAALQNSGGITNLSATQDYGTIAVGATVSRNFTFRVPYNAVCGSSVTLTFQAQDGATAYTFTKTYTLGTLPLINSENFDSVTAPALPAGWTSTQSGTGTGWTTSTILAASAPNAAFAGNPATVGLSDLESPVWNVTTVGARLDFKINYDTEPNFDGAVLEIKIGSGAYQDIIAAGGSFTAGSYNRTLNTGFSNPLPGRAAWSGNSNGYVSASVNLPAAANNQPVQFRWRMGSDNLVGATGVRLDDVRLLGAYICSVPTPTNLIVNKTADTNDGVCDVADCSLREALDVADGDGAFNIITFNIPTGSANCVGGNCTITLGSPLAPAADSGVPMIIDGAAGANTITLSGGGNIRLLRVGSGANLNVNNLNFTGGGNFNGGAIAVDGGGNLTLTNSALYGNANNAPGGGMRCESGCTANLTNVTISGNSSPNSGGISNAGTITATGCTITNNSGGFNAGGVTNSGTFNIRSTIIAGNNSDFAAQADVFGGFASQGYNLVGKTDGSNGFTMTGDQTGTVASPLNAQLGGLADNGGKTRTHALLDSSPAIDRGNGFGALADQRDFLRPIDIATVVNMADGADVGAFEYRSLPTAATVMVAGRVIVGNRGLLNATVTLTDQNGNARTARTTAFGYYRFDEVEAGQTYIVSVRSKRFQFAPQVISVTEDLSELNFYSDGGGLR